MKNISNHRPVEKERERDLEVVSLHEGYALALDLIHPINHQSLSKWSNSLLSRTSPFGT